MTRQERILIVDDEPTNATLAALVLERAGFRNVVTLHDSSKISEEVHAHQPALLLLDLHMSGADGFTVLETLRAEHARSPLMPVLVVTGDSSADSWHRARASGADDYLLKPFDVRDLVMRVEGLLTMRASCLSLEGDGASLRQHIGACRSIITTSELDMLSSMTRALPAGDPLGGHCDRVGVLAAAIARELGLAPSTVDAIRAAAPLHDVGKVAVSDDILLKPGKLDPAELAIVRRHTIIGGFLLSGTDLPLLQLASQIALHHHERWDGAGYPKGLSGDDIPLAARIVAVADVFDALTSERSYKAAWPVDEALREIFRQSGAQFDPRVVRALMAVLLYDRDLDTATVDPAAGQEDVLSLSERQRQREAQLQAAITMGQELQRAGLVWDVTREAVA